MRFVGDHKAQNVWMAFQEIIISIYNIETIELSSNSSSGYCPLLSAVFIYSWLSVLQNSNSRNNKNQPLLSYFFANKEINNMLQSRDDWLIANPQVLWLHEHMCYLKVRNIHAFWCIIIYLFICCLKVRFLRKYIVLNFLLLSGAWFQYDGQCIWGLVFPWDSRTIFLLHTICLVSSS